MNKKIIIILFCLFINPIIYTNISAYEIHEKSTSHDSELYFFMFNSYMDLEFDVTPLNDPISPYQSVYIPLEIEYWTDIPSNFLWFLPWQIRNLILFKSLIRPMQKINISIENPPEFGQFYVTQPNILIDFPQGDEKSLASLGLIIMLDEYAPSQAYILTITASCNEVGRISGFRHQESIVFTPQYIPCIEIEYDSVVHTPPDNVTNIPIIVRNCGNSATRVTPSLDKMPYDILNEWATTINPPTCIIGLNGSCEFYFSVIAPINFSGIQNFELEFKAEIFPIRPGSPNISIPIYILLYT